MTREDLELYVMGMYEGDVAALERDLAEDPAARAIVAEEARLDLLLRDAAAAAAFCPVCDDLVSGGRCDACGAAVKPGGYTVDRVLVSNAHGRMYAARDVDGKQVALKELAFVQSPTPEALAAFEREARFLRALDHPAIPRFCASFQEGEGAHARYYLAQELVVGEALDDRLEAHWFSEAEIRGIARQVLEVLVYLQNLSPMVIHRDIKPANLLVRPDGTIAVVDFGAAHGHGMTATSTAIGTFGYMPIEQLAGEVDATTDLYALGASLIHLLTRREPWRILQDGLLADAVVNVSRPMRAFLTRLVAPNPRDRFRSAAEAVTALDRLDRKRRLLPSVRLPSIRLPSLHLSVPRVAVAVVTVAALGAAFTVQHAKLETKRAKEARFSLERDRVRLTGNQVVAALAALTDDMCGCTERRCIDRVTQRVARWSADVVPSADWADPEAAREVTRLSERLSVCVTRVVTEALKPEAVKDGAGWDGTITVKGRTSLEDRASGSVLLPTTGTAAMALHEAVRAIAESCNVNVVIPGQITAEMTGKPSRVPCDRALDVVLRSTDLEYEVHDASIVRIAPRSEFALEHAARASRARRSIVDDRLPQGGEVDLHGKQQPVREAIKLLARAGDVDVVLPDKLDDTVTVHIAHVAWDRALVAILEASGLGYRYDEARKQLRIAPIADIDAERASALPHGFLEVKAGSRTRVTIDGVETELPAGKPLELATGTHRITLTKPGGSKSAFLVDITPGSTTTIRD